jgi:NADH:ubiquinone reductase (H+-translocating)
MDNKIDRGHHAPQRAPQRIVIIGGGYAGLVAAIRLARQGGSRLEIHLVNPRDRFVERIRLHEAAAGYTIKYISIRKLLRGTNIIFHEELATGLDWQARTVTLQSGALLHYDKLLYALGSQIDRTTPGAAEHALALDDLHRAAEITQRLAALPNSSEVVVVGGGLTGTEMVTELAERYPHLHWSLLTRDIYRTGYAPAARAYLLDALARRAIQLRQGVEVEAIAPDHVVTTEGNLPFALCLWAGSFRAPTLARQAGLPVNALDQLHVDATLRVAGAPDIYAVGDSAVLPGSYRPHLVMGCKVAMPMGIHAAENILAELRGEAPLPLRFAYTLTCVSLGRKDGLVQLLDAEGRPQPRFFRGRLAAWIKELICRSTIYTLWLERHMDFYDLFVPSAHSVARSKLEESAAHGH